jgi:hypothetical protein
MDPVLRDDGELLGLVAADPAGGWLALTVFHGRLGYFPDRAAAERHVRATGLASLGERWYWFSRRTSRWHVVVPVEGRPGELTAAMGYYSLPGSETVLITAADLAAGDDLTLDPPDGHEPADLWWSSGASDDG